MKNIEEHLIKGLREGKEEAYRKLFDLYYNKLFCIARQYLKDDFISETVVGDLFFHLWENRKSIQIETSLNAYLIRSVRNSSLNYLQKNYVEKEVSMQSIAVDLYSTEEYPLGILLEKELLEIFQKEVDKLPYKTKQVFILSRIEHHTYTEISESLDISVNTVKYHVKQFLSILKNNLKGYLSLVLIAIYFLF